MDRLGASHKHRIVTYKKLVALAFLLIIVASLPSAPTAGALTTQFNMTDGGNNLTFTEAAQKSVTGSQTVNTTQFSFAIPNYTANWQGYKLATTVDFDNTRQFTKNPGFDGGFGSNWYWTKSAQGNDGSNITGGYTSASYPSGSIKAGAGYNTLIGKTTERNATLPDPLINNMNFTSSGSGWSAWYNGSSGNWNSLSYGYSSGAMRMYAYAAGVKTCSIHYWLNTTFPYSGLPYPDLAWITYSFWVPRFDFYRYSSRTVQYDVRIQNMTSPTKWSQVVSPTLITGTSQQPNPASRAPYSANIAPYLTKSGINYKLTIHLQINVILYSSSSFAYVDVMWDNIGIYAKYGKFTLNSRSYIYQPISFGKSTLAATLTFWYWTNMSTLVQAIDSNITIWIWNGVTNYTYTVVSFQDAVKNTWKKVDWVLSPSMINNRSSLEVRLGLILGQDLQITKNAKRSVLFDNVTLTVLYKPLPSEVKLRIVDHQGGRANVTGTTLGKGSAVLSALPMWNPIYASFRFEANYSQATVSYTATIYVRRVFQASDRPDLLFTSDRSTGTWTFTYSVPDTEDPGAPGNSSLGYQHYNINVTVPNEWGIAYAKYGGSNKTSSCNIIPNNSTTKILAILDSAFGVPNTYWGFPLEIQMYSPNYLFPPGNLVTQVNKTNGPNPTSWETASYFYPGNYTRLLISPRNSTGGLRGIQGTSCSVVLYNVTTSVVWSKNWSNVPVNSTGYAQVVVYWDFGNISATGQTNVWCFAVNWTNGFAAANRYVNFSTRVEKSPYTPTTLVATPVNFLGDNAVPFNTSTSFYVTYANGRNGVGITLASVKWNWVGNSTSNDMIDNGDGTYDATIGRHEILKHYGSNTINVTAIRPVGTMFRNQTTLIDISVRPVRTRLDLSSAFNPNPVPWNNISSLKIQFYDIDHDTGISSNVLLKVNETTSGFSGNVTVTSQDDYFIVGINSSFASTGSRSYGINVTAARWGYENSSLPTFPILNVRDRQVDYSLDPTSFVTPWNDPFKFNLMCSDSDLHGAGIPSANIAVNWSHTTQYKGGGIYGINLTGTNVSLMTYVVNVSISKPHYETHMIYQSFTVRQIYTAVSSLSGSLIEVPWGDNVTISLRYRDLDHSPTNITGGQAFVSGWPSGYWTPTESSGTYTLKLNTTLCSEGDVPLTIRMTKPNYQDGSLSLTVRIRLIATKLTTDVSSISIIYTNNATFVIKFNDTDHGDIGIYTDTFIVEGWYWGIDLKTDLSSQGVYTLTFVTADFYVPYGATLAIKVQLAKPHYVSQMIQLSLRVDPVPTEIHNIAAPGATTVPYGQPIRIDVVYWDQNHTAGIDSATMTCNWTKTPYSVLINGNGNYTYYIPTIGATEGTYVLSFSATRYGFTQLSGNWWTITIRKVNTTLTSVAVADVPYSDNATVYVYYYDVDFDTGVVSGTFTSNWTFPLSIESFSPSTGRYGLTFKTTGFDEGTYVIMIIANKSHYDGQVIVVTFMVRSINAIVSITSSPTEVITGGVAEVTVFLSDVDHDVGIIGAASYLTIVGVDSSHYTISETGAGYYKIVLTTDWIPGDQLPFAINFSVSAAVDHYSIQPSSVSFQVVAGGLSPMMIIIAGGGSGGAAILAVLGYVLYRRAKIPFVVKKIDQSIKLISKGEMPPPVPMRSRAELVQSIFRGKVAILSKEKIEEFKAEKEKKRKKEPEKPREPSEKKAREVKPKEAEAKPKKAKAPAPSETEEADVDMIVRELEKLESKEGMEPSEESDFMKREREEFEKGKKKKD